MTSDDDLVKGASYNYSDCLIQWQYDVSQDAQEKANEKFTNRNCAANIEFYLQTYFKDQDLKLVHVLAGVNLSSGYDYQVFGYIPGEPKAALERGES